MLDLFYLKLHEIYAKEKILRRSLGHYDQSHFKCHEIDQIDDKADENPDNPATTTIC